MEINETKGNNYSELNRKIFHLFTLIYPVFYNIVPKDLMLICAGAVVIIDITLESLRLTFSAFNNFVLKFFRSIYRENEINNVSALVWTLTGAFLTMFIFDDKKIVTVILLYMCLGDSVAGLVGTRHGKIKFHFVKRKSVEGSFGCFLICFISGYFFLPWPTALFGAFVATLVELLPLPLNDNFWVPLISGFTITLFSKMFY